MQAYIGHKSMWKGMVKETLLQCFHEMYTVKEYMHIHLLYGVITE